MQSYGIIHKLGRCFIPRWRAFLPTPSLPQYNQPHAPTQSPRNNRKAARGRLTKTADLRNHAQVNMFFYSTVESAFPTTSLSENNKSHASTQKPRSPKKEGWTMQAYQKCEGVKIQKCLFHGGRRFFPLFPNHIAISPVHQPQKTRKTERLGEASLQKNKLAKSFPHSAFLFHGGGRFSHSFPVTL